MRICPEMNLQQLTELMTDGARRIEAQYMLDLLLSQDRVNDTEQIDERTWFDLCNEAYVNTPISPALLKSLVQQEDRLAIKALTGDHKALTELKRRLRTES